MEMEWKEEFFSPFFLRLCLPKLEQMHEVGSWEAFDEEKDRRKETRTGREESFSSCFWGRGGEDRKSAAVCFLRKAMTSDVLPILFCHHMQNKALPNVTRSGTSD